MILLDLYLFFITLYTLLRIFATIQLIYIENGMGMMYIIYIFINNTWSPFWDKVDSYD